ncbi:rRNA N6-adenosine-methyltransferase zcchc4 [Perkinsus olseni]|uniref:rRNA N(6)-adenosine-methyltransferase ZCCHC4 n=1 Tax=Perkinsus olseni TaxID=32597 RepID=A0A7J6P228_PEROL|nr:rRNA N6-adenosine-methyltransferase zcchc4 [Perkinsus olseni]KAF4708567.1 rRNA N6-adenosine-methyltransferase zcchc4 [Perkinsus olseni]
MARGGFSHAERRTINKLLLDEADAGVPPPQCEHGPAMRFRRVTKSADGSVVSSRDFYACSAIRDRKICPLFVWVDEHERHGAEHPAKRIRRAGPARQYEKTDNKANAQYFFSNEALSVIEKYISKHGYRRVLCLGTPVVHRRLREEKDMDAFLLDMDSVVVEKAGTSGARFNMVNGFFFGSEEKKFASWLKKGPLDIVVVDPPFQPELVPAIWRCTREVLLGPEVFAKVDVLFAFPYFSRDALVGSEDAPELVMNDYRVDYANHRTYKADKSPVRFFTRFHELTDLPAASYRVCEKCGGRWVHKVNAHCDTCRACTTLHGNKAWSHCAGCGKCTKPELKHCEKCERCLPVEHTCTRH